MSDNPEIKQYLAEALKNGISLSEAQNLINEKFGVKLTFRDVRILAAELDSVDWRSRDPEPPKEEAEAAPEAVPAGTGKTVVEASKVLQPGTLASGTVTFGSGASAEWFVDQRGQLGLDKVKGEPTDEDVKDFQLELQKLFGR